MNLSEKKEANTLQGELPNIRTMYCVPEGRVLVHADYSQQELRIMYAVSGDEALGEALRTGDVYSYDARQWFKLGDDFDVKGKKPAARKASKIIHLAFQYQASTGAVFNQALIQDRHFKYALARELHVAAKELYVGTTHYWAVEHDSVCEKGYSEGRLIGNRRYYPREPPPTETANYPVQCTAGELTALSMIELRDRMRHDFPSARIITILHDAFDVECDEDDCYGVAALMDEVMSQPRLINGRHHEFPVDVKFGANWGQV
jgi:DNA polymerase I-like protein with 3'-5' exonuclease and polymerase domains